MTFDFNLRRYNTGNVQDIDAAAGTVVNGADLEVFGVKLEVRIEASCTLVPR
jgi:hypothetical protein